MVVASKSVSKPIPTDRGVPTKVMKVKGGFNYYYEDGPKQFVSRKEYFK